MVSFIFYVVKSLVHISVEKCLDIGDFDVFFTFEIPYLLVPNCVQTVETFARPICRDKDSCDIILTTNTNPSSSSELYWITTTSLFSHSRLHVSSQSTTRTTVLISLCIFSVVGVIAKTDVRSFYCCTHTIMPYMSRFKFRWIKSVFSKQ